MYQLASESEGEEEFGGGIYRDELVFISTVSLVADPCRLPSNLVPKRRQS